MSFCIIYWREKETQKKDLKLMTRKSEYRYSRENGSIPQITRFFELEINPIELWRRETETIFKTKKKKKNNY